MEIKKDDLINLTKEELYKDNESMFKSYKEYKKKYIIIMEIDKKLKIDLKNIENKYLELENINKKLNDNLNVLTNEKTIWINKDKYMTEFLNRNGFIDPDELESFIIEYKSHNCLCSCPAIEDNEKYKEQVMNVDILKFNEKERLRVEKENEGLRYDIDIGMKKRDRDIENLNNKLLLIDKKVKLEKSNKYNENLFNNYIKEINDECYYIENVEIEDNIVNVNFEKPNKVVINNTDHYINLENNLEISNNIKDDNKIENINEEENEIDDISQTSDNTKNINDNKIIKKQKIKKEIIIYEDFSFDGCPLISINNKDDMEIDWKQHVSTEIYRIIKDNKDLYEKIKKDKNIDKKTLKSAIDYILEKRDMKDIGSNRKHIRYSILRSYTLFKLYSNDLKYINFSLNKIIRLNKQEWEMFLKHIDYKIKKMHLEVQKLKNYKIDEIDNSEFIDIKENIIEEPFVDKNEIKSDEDNYETDEEYNYCIIDNCDNYVPEKGWICKSHL